MNLRGPGAVLLVAHRRRAPGLSRTGRRRRRAAVREPRAGSRVSWLREGVASLVSDALDAAGLEVVGARRSRRGVRAPAAAGAGHRSAVPRRSRWDRPSGAAVVVVGRVELRRATTCSVTARAVRLDSGRLLARHDRARPPWPTSSRWRRASPARLAWPSGVHAAVAGRPRRWPPSRCTSKGLIADTPGRRARLLRAGPESRARLRRGAPGTVAAAHRTGRAPARARRGDRRARPTATCRARGAIRGGDVAPPPRSGTTRRSRRARTLQSDAPLAVVANAWAWSSCAGGPRLRRGVPRTSSTRRPRSIRRTRTTSSTWAMPTGSRRTRVPPRTGCGKRVRRDPADGDAHFVLSAALQQTGAATEATRERELARRLSSRFAAVGSARGWRAATWSRTGSSACATGWIGRRAAWTPS